MSQPKRQRSTAEPDRDVPPACSNCRCWADLGNGDGKCRRYPPGAGVVKTTPHGPIHAFPVLPAEEWCGEHRAKD
jgi:hypothetical protein